MREPKKKQLNLLLKFSNLCIQMGLMIGLGTYAGLCLDNIFKLEHVFTVLLSLLAIFGSLLYVVREAKKI